MTVEICNQTFTLQELDQRLSQVLSGTKKLFISNINGIPLETVFEISCHPELQN